MKVGDNKENKTLFSPEWRIGSCYGPKIGSKYYYDYYLSHLYSQIGKIHYDKCCLPSGTYTLICKNTKSKYGWGNAVFKIDGKRYCDDFVGFISMRTVSLQGNLQKS